MCDTGGPRCEYSGKWLLERRRLERTKKYKEANSHQKKELLRKHQDKFQKEHSSEYQSHLPAREKWQTKASPLPRRQMEALSKTFPRPRVLSPEEGTALAEVMGEEHAELLKDLPADTRHALNTYSMASFEDINGYLRRGDKGVDQESSLGGEGRIAQVQERIEAMNKLFQEFGTSETPRVLYRHMLAPQGIATRAYASKYFKVGERVRDKAFLSTTQDPAYIRGHAHYREPSDYVVFQILSPKGISLQPKDRESVGHLQSWEKERLLPSGVNFRVAGIRREEFAVHEDRYQMHKQFNKSAYSYWKKIPPKNFTVVQLVDEDLL